MWSLTRDSDVYPRPSRTRPTCSWTRTAREDRRLPRACGAVGVPRRLGAHVNVERHPVELAFEQEPRPGRYPVFAAVSQPPRFTPARRARVCRSCHGRGVPAKRNVETGLYLAARRGREGTRDDPAATRRAPTRRRPAGRQARRPDRAAARAAGDGGTAAERAVGRAGRARCGVRGSALRRRSSVAPGARGGGCGCHGSDRAT